MLEAYEQAAEVLAVLIDTMVEFLHLWLLKVSDHLLLQLATALTGNDLQYLNSTIYTMFHGLFQSPVDLPAFIVDLMQIEFVSRYFNRSQFRISPSSAQENKP